jgi:hypothetical protein
MRSLMLGAAVIALVTFPAMAQTSSPGQMPQTTTPNSGAQVEGHPGNKNGPPASSETTGANPAPSNADKTPQDVSKVPGLPGNKSGPPVRRPSQTNTSK